jgi:hypothetical protein
LGVNEAVARFFLEGGGTRLTPFYYCTNKLFCCRPEYHGIYARAAETFVRSYEELYPEARNFVQLDKTWRGSVEVEYFGHKILVVH